MSTYDDRRDYDDRDEWRDDIDHSDEPGDPGPDEGWEPLYPRPTWQEE